MKFIKYILISIILLSCAFHTFKTEDGFDSTVSIPPIGYSSPIVVDMTDARMDIDGCVSIYEICRVLCKSFPHDSSDKLACQNKCLQDYKGCVGCFIIK